MIPEKVAIIGAGPAGISAAIQLKRYGLKPLLFESDQVGGLVRNAWKVENYPGFHEGISGIELAGIMQRQLKNAGVIPISRRVTNLAFNHDSEQYILHTENSEYQTGIVIVAVGTKAKQPEFIDKLPDRLKKRILGEVHSILSVVDKRIIIIGTGDVGLDYAVNLSRKNDVTVLNRNDSSDALPLLRNLAVESGRISIMENTEVHDIIESSDGGLEMSLEQEGASAHLDADYIITAVGRKPADDFIDNTLRSHEKDLVQRGILYYAGDVANGIYRQVGIAVGDGLRAAMRICRKLKERKLCV